MRASVLGTALVLAGTVFAQGGTGNLPKCAQTCVTEFTSGSQIGSCGALDAKCICSNKSFLGDIACCLAAACDAADQAAAVAYAKSLCTTQGVTVPDSVVCASSSSSAAPTATKNAGLHNTAATGVGVAGGLAAMLVLL